MISLPAVGVTIVIDIPGGAETPITVDNMAAHTTGVTAVISIQITVTTKVGEGEATTKMAVVIDIVGTVVAAAIKRTTVHIKCSNLSNDTLLHTRNHLNTG